MAHLHARQIWADPTETSEPRCTAYHLPSSGVLVLNESTTITLDGNAIYQPLCTAIATSVGNATLPVLELGDPFEASTVPQMFVLGCVLVIAWSLLIILLITPRTSFIVSGAGSGLLGSGGTRNGNGGAITAISIGGRPWLQKFAAATVGISLAIAAANSFKIIQDQYNEGFEDAMAVTIEVVGSLEIRIIRVISTTSLWLAQVQTLIRLFPRHREKVIIKWSGFGLIVLDTLFSILNNFVADGGDGPSTVRPRYFTEAIPALSYLFELALGLLYAAWVFYYALVKRRFAFFHPKMRNICLVALLSIVSVSIPVVFFVMDIAKSDLAGWGDYIRWVGAAAASVVVWEWVERIEALEREERKDGILGREIFDGDEMLQTTPSTEVQWPWSRSIYKTHDSGSSGSFNGGKTHSFRATSLAATVKASKRSRISTRTQKRNAGINTDTGAPNAFGRPMPDRRVSPLQTSVSPVSRSDTTSANSTVYAVVHHPVSPPAGQTRLETIAPGIRFAPDPTPRPRVIFRNPISNEEQAPTDPLNSAQALATRFQSVSNPFKRRRHSPPPEVSRSAVDAAGAPSAARWAKSRSPKNLFRINRQQELLPSELPVVVVPAQPRGRVWSPPTDDRDNGFNTGNSPSTMPLVTSRLSQNISGGSTSSSPSPLGQTEIREQSDDTASPSISTNAMNVSSVTTENSTSHTHSAADTSSEVISSESVESPRQDQYRTPVANPVRRQDSLPLPGSSIESSGATPETTESKSTSGPND
ncbi:pH-response regulator protein palH/rim21 [Thelotrema lepadinum]|nr:pH-response regulator protein palH/rim21 [Thelotrema lepadinum]